MTNDTQIIINREDILKMLTYLNNMENALKDIALKFNSTSEGTASSVPIQAKQYSIDCMCLKYQRIINKLESKALEGVFYSCNAFITLYQSYDEFGVRETIRRNLGNLFDTGHIKFFSKPEKYGIPKKPGSVYGYMCTENMVAGNLPGKKIPVKILPTHYREKSSGKLMPVEDPETWVYFTG